MLFMLQLIIEMNSLENLSQPCGSHAFVDYILKPATLWKDMLNCKSLLMLGALTDNYTHYNAEISKNIVQLGLRPKPKL